MYNLVSVTVFNRTNDLLEKSPGLVLLHLSILHNIIEEFPARVFEYHYDFGLGFDDGIAILVALVPHFDHA